MAGEAVFDKLIFALDGDLSALKKAYADAEVGAQKTGATIHSNLGKGFKDAADSINTHGGRIKATLGDIDAHGRKAGEGIAVSRREFIYLGRELVNGDWQRAPATIALLASHFFELSGAAVATTIAIAAVPVALVAASVQAELALNRVKTALEATGHASGVTLSQIQDMASKLSDAGVMSAPRALSTLSILAGRGNINAAGLPLAAQASQAFSTMSGLPRDEATTKFEAMMTDAAKGAADLNTQFKLLTNAQTLEVEKLVAHGKTLEAQEIIEKAVISRGKNVEDSLWSLSKAADAAGNWLSNLWYHTGSPPMSDGQRMAALNRERADAAHQVQFGLAPASELKKIDKERGDLHYKMRIDDEAAAAAAKDVAKDQAETLARSAGALAIQSYNDAARVAGASPRDRNMLKARLDAERQYQSNLNNPDMAGFAGDIRSAAISAAAAEQSAARREALTLSKQATEAEEALAVAYDKSMEAGNRQNAVNKAHSEYLKGTIDNEKAETGYLERQAFAQERMSVSKKIANDNISIAGLRRVAAAGGNAAGINDANAINVATVGTAGEFADAGALSGNAKYVAMMQAQSHFDTILAQERSKNAVNRQIDINKEITGLQQQNQLEKLNLDLKYADATERAKAIADLEAEQEVTNMGLKGGTAEYNQTLAKIKALKEYKATLDSIGDSREGQMMDAFRSGLESTLSSGVTGFKNMRDAAANFVQQLAQMAMQLYIIRPLMNGLFGGGGGLGGIVGSLLGSAGGIVAPDSSGLISAAFSGFNAASFGGGRASGGFVDPGKFYVVGENGPEILSGVGGKITPIGGSAPANSNAQTINYSITVGGNGDKELLQRMSDVAAMTVSKGIEQNNKIAKRIQRGSLINSTKRALA